MAFKYNCILNLFSSINLLTTTVLPVSKFIWWNRTMLVTVNWPNIKQLLDEVEHDIMNYQNRGLCYLPNPKADADNTDTRF